MSNVVPFSSRVAGLLRLPAGYKLDGETQAGNFVVKVLQGLIHQLGAQDLTNETIEWMDAHNPDLTFDDLGGGGVRVRLEPEVKPEEAA